MKFIKYPLLLLVLLFLFDFNSIAQITGAPEQNCIGGIPVCQYSYTQLNSYAGPGTDTELNASNQGCLGSGEKNGVWYIINVVSPGLIRFNITPVDLTNDYDFAVWDITGTGCSAIFDYSTNTPLPYNPVRCNYSGIPGLTGLDDTATQTSLDASAGNGTYCSSLPVVAGQTYAILISNFSTSVNGYTIDFSPSSASIFDTLPPLFKGPIGACVNSDSLVINMTQPLLCSSLDANASNFYITPGNISVLSATSAICALGGTTTINYTLHLSSAIPLGNYVLHAKKGDDSNTVLSACGYAQPITDSIAFSLLNPATVTAGPDIITCVNYPYQLSAHLTSPADSGITYTYVWTPDAYISNDSIANPYVTPPTDTSYVVNVLQNGYAGCSIPDTVHITELQGFTLLNHDTTICGGQSVPLMIVGDTRYTYYWSPARGLTDSTLNDPLATPDTTTTYRITAYYPGCPDSVASVKITVNPTPIVIAGSALFKCVPDTIGLNATVIPASSYYTYSWVPGSGLTDSTILNPAFFGDTTTLLHLIVSTPLGCNDTDSVLVTVYPNNFSTISTPDTAICPGDSIRITITGGAVYAFSPSYGVSDTTIANPLVSPQIQTSYTIYIHDIHGCADTQYITVAVHPAALILLPDSVTLYPGDSYTMDPQGNCVTYRWFPPLGLSDTTIANPIAMPDVNTRYFVYAATDLGCRAIDSVEVYIDPTTFLAVPNAFTPDGIANPTLKVIRRGAATLNYFRIFNRWGAKVFETTDIDMGWDGRLNGAPQPYGVYVYEVEAVTGSGKHFTKHGNITLIR